MAYPPKQPPSSAEIQAEYTQVLARTGALFYQVKELKERLSVAEADLAKLKELKDSLQAAFQAAVKRESEEAKAKDQPASNE